MARRSFKADAVVVVYDITSEKTFLNAREWLDSAVDGTDKAALMLLGNKLDLAQDDLMRWKLHDNSK